MKIDVFYIRMISKYLQPMRFSILCTPSDSSDKTRLMCSTILTCSFVSWCCSWLHRFELLRQAQAKDGNSGH